MPDDNYENNQPVAMPAQVHLSDYLNILKRRKWTVILIFALIVGVTTIISLRMTPVYRATAQVIIEQPPSHLDFKEGRMNRNQEEAFYLTQYNLLRSKSLAADIVKKLDLARYLADTSRSETNRLTSYVNAAVENKGEMDTRSALIGWYLSHLQIIPLRNTHLVNISFQGKSPDLIAKITNAHAEAAIRYSVASQQQGAQEALDWLMKQVDAQKVELSAAQRAIYEYKKENDIISLEGRQNVVTQQLVEISSALTRARSDRMARQTVYDQLQAASVGNDKLFSLPEIARDPVIQKMRSRLVDLKAQELELSTVYGPKHPKRIEIRSGIGQLKQELADEVERLKKTILTELNRARINEQSLEKSLQAQKERAVFLDEKAIQHEMLKNKAKSSEGIYNMLLNQSNEVGLVRGINFSNIRIVDRAGVPRYPVKPRVSLNILLAMVLGMFFGTGLAFFLEYMDNTVKTRHDLVMRLNLPALGTLPYDKMLKKRNLPLFKYREGKNDKAIARIINPINEISNGLPAQLEGPLGHVFLIESATVNEGKTTVLANLGINFAEAGIRTLLIDYDLHRSRVHKLFGLSNDDGLVNAIERIMTWDLTSGNLNQCSIGDLFFMIALKKLSGILMVENESHSQSMAVYFQGGRLQQVKNVEAPESSRLGNMLINGGFINENQLKDALARQQRTRRPLGYVLVNAGYIQRDKLRGPLRLQMEEHLQKLFSWKNGKYLFKPSDMRLCDMERIDFSEDYTGIIDELGKLEGSRLIENTIVSRIWCIPEKKLHILPAGTGDSKSRGLFNRAIIAKFLHIIKTRFDVVLIDAPPLDAATGAAALARLVDGVVLVVKAGHLSAKTINQAVDSISREKIVGAILNQAKVKKGDYGYRYYS